MDTKVELSIPDENRIVYVRPVAVADLPSELQVQAGGVERIYSIHNAEGERLALVKDRKMAFILADQNDYSPVSVH